MKLDYKTDEYAIKVTFLGFSQLTICRAPTPLPAPPPLLRNGQIYMKDEQCDETNEKNILRFLVIEIRSILYSKFLKYCTILS